ncbi:MAG: diaminopimelate decarboxylase [Chloroflexi bacterium]|nr:MAG: diaminopimelate decarboxylase [Chloroflexota bacterium]
MNFAYREDELCCERVPVSTIARAVGTPFYLYSLDEIERRVRAYQAAFPRALIAYAYKANANLAILRHLVSLGVGADVVSGGELWRALHVGTPPAQIVFNGNGKTATEIGYALDSELLSINVDSAEELELVAEVARAKGRTAPISFRVNPDIDPQTHPYISTGLRQSKFGIPIAEAEALYVAACKHPELQIVGVHCHIGSQITQASPLREAAQSVHRFVIRLRTEGVPLALVNLGGGLGIRYHGENPLTAGEWAEVVHDVFGQGSDLQIILEPGRSIVAPAGALVASVIHLKRTPEKNFLVLDAGMNALLRPPLYGAFHEVRPVQRSQPSTPLHMDIVGPICESADVLGKDRVLPQLKRGDRVAVMDAGAYGFSMASRYNQQPLPAEVVVQENQWRVVTRHETFEQMAASEEDPVLI